jgi:hypothetical protein
MFDKYGRGEPGEVRFMTNNGHILIVEDEPVSAAMIEHQLVKLGYGIAGITGFGENANGNVPAPPGVDGHRARRRNGRRGGCQHHSAPI